jgi:hypothetical protein
MKTLKMSLENIQGKLSRIEMKNIMAGSTGSGDHCGDICGPAYPPCDGSCQYCTTVPNWNEFICTN